MQLGCNKEMYACFLSLFTSSFYMLQGAVPNSLGNECRSLSDVHIPQGITEFCIV
jgi:hypothetical protein